MITNHAAKASAPKPIESSRCRISPKPTARYHAAWTSECRGIIQYM